MRSKLSQVQLCRLSSSTFNFVRHLDFNPFLVYTQIAHLAQVFFLLFVQLPVPNSKLLTMGGSHSAVEKTFKKNQEYISEMNKNKVFIDFYRSIA